MRTAWSFISARNGASDDRRDHVILLLFKHILCHHHIEHVTDYGIRHMAYYVVDAPLAGVRTTRPQDERGIR